MSLKENGYLVLRDKNSLYTGVAEELVKSMEKCAEELTKKAICGKKLKTNNFF